MKSTTMWTMVCFCHHGAGVKRQVGRSRFMSSHIPKPGVATTGVGGLDAILGGGLPRQSIYLIQGHPGSGKTLLGIQFLREGAAKNESCLYVTAGEGREHLN